MTNITAIKSSTDVLETIEEFKKSHEKYQCVMLLAIDKDGAQILRTSTMNGYEKSFLVGFLNAWLSSWFNIGPN